MNAREAYDEIRRLASKGYIRFVAPHAYDRMDERGATKEDVRNALVTAHRVHRQTNPKWNADRWEVTGGVDLEGDVLRVIVEIEADVVVVTITD